MENEKRDFKGIWIPKEIWLNKELNWQEKIILCEIDSYTSNDRSCFFSNEYIGEFLGISARQASLYIGNLIQKRYIQQTGFDGRKRYLKSNLKLIRSRVEENFQAEIDRKKSSTLDSNNPPGSIEENFHHINTVTNINTNIDINTPNKYFCLCFQKEYQQEYKQLLEVSRYYKKADDTFQRYDDKKTIVEKAILCIPYFLTTPFWFNTVGRKGVKIKKADCNPLTMLTNLDYIIADYDENHIEKKAKCPADMEPEEKRKWLENLRKEMGIEA